MSSGSLLNNCFYWLDGPVAVRHRGHYVYFSSGYQMGVNSSTFLYEFGCLQWVSNQLIWELCLLCSGSRTCGFVLYEEIKKNCLELSTASRLT
jgi:hypothetical protein